LESQSNSPCPKSGAFHHFVEPEYDTPATAPSAPAEVPEEFLERLRWLLSNPQNEEVMNGPIPVPQLALAIAAIEQAKAMQEIAGALHRIEDHLREMRDANIQPKNTFRPAWGGNPSEKPPRHGWHGTYHSFRQPLSGNDCLECDGGKHHSIHREGL